MLIFGTIAIVSNFSFVYTLVKAITLAIEKEQSWTNWAWGAALCLALAFISANLTFGVLATWL